MIRIESITFNWFRVLTCGWTEPFGFNSSTRPLKWTLLRRRRKFPISTLDRWKESLASCWFRVCEEPYWNCFLLDVLKNVTVWLADHKFHFLLCRFLFRAYWLNRHFLVYIWCYKASNVLNSSFKLLCCLLQSLPVLSCSFCLHHLRFLPVFETLIL